MIFRLQLKPHSVVPAAFGTLLLAALACDLPFDTFRDEEDESGIPGLIGNRVWLDADEDGIQDEEEEGIAGVTVSLIDEDGGVLETQQTQADGHVQLH